MKLLAVLEHRFYQDLEGRVYCERIVDYNFIKRYLNVFEEVVVCGRFKIIDSPDSPIKKNLRVDGDNVSFVKLPDFKGPKEMVLKYLSSKRIIKKAVEDCDAVLLRAPSPTSFISLSVVKKANKPFAVEMVANPRTGMQINSNYNIFSRMINHLIKAVWINHAKKVCRYANGVSYVTQYALQNEYPSHARIYGNTKYYFEDSYSTINLKETDYYSEEYLKLKPVNTTFTICHTGYMDGKTKGHITVIDTLNILLKAGYDVNVKFIGSGKLIEEFKEYATSLGIIGNVRFLGSLYGYNEVQKELVTSDLFLFPTMSEGLPRSLIEAMANRLPCVSSPVDGIPELLDEEFLAPYNSPRILAQKVEHLINNPSIRGNAALKNYNKAKEYAESELTPRRNRFYTKLYELAISNK